MSKKKKRVLKDPDAYPLEDLYKQAEYYSVRLTAIAVAMNAPKPESVGDAEHLAWRGRAWGAWWVFRRIHLRLMRAIARKQIGLLLPRSDEQQQAHGREVVDALCRLVRGLNARDFRENPKVRAAVERLCDLCPGLREFVDLPSKPSS